MTGAEDESGLYEMKVAPGYGCKPAGKLLLAAKDSTWNACFATPIIRTSLLVDELQKMQVMLL